MAQKMFRDEEILHDAIRKNLHPEKSFVESTKIWLAQQNFSFKCESMEILFKLTKTNIFHFCCCCCCNFNKNILYREKKMNCK